MGQDNQENDFEQEDKNIEISALIPEIGDIDGYAASGSYTDEYKDIVFYSWYNAGKCTFDVLYDIIPFPKTNYGRKPSIQALKAWIKNFSGRAEELDRGVQKSLDNAMIQSKVEMLKRHAQLGTRMQDIGFGFLTGTADMTAASAVRLLVEGIRVERESIGIPGALELIRNKTDEELMDEVMKLIENTPIDNDLVEDGKDD